MSDYSDSGFDSFLSRSIDNLQQVNLDSQGPYSTATAYDRSQLSGSMGDKFNMGGIGMSAKDSTMTVNDGQIQVNDTTSNNAINLSSGNITYFDNTGNLVVQEGILPDGATGIRIVDKQQIGLAQFGRDKYGVTALKIAKDGYEVSTANNDQMIFNSSQNIFKIVDTDTITLSHTVVAAPTTTTTTTKVHGLGYIPGMLAFITLDPVIMSGALANSTVPNPYPILYIVGGGSTLTLAGQAEVYLDELNVYFTLRTFGVGNGTYNCSAKFYLFQETFT